MRKVAGWGSQDIPSGSYPGTPRSPVRHPEIDGSKGPAGCASGSERPSPAIDRGLRTAAFRSGVGLSFRHLPMCYPCVRVTKDRKSTRLNSSHITISYAVFCLKKKTILHEVG